MINIDEIRQKMELLNDAELIKIFREHDEGQWRPEVFDIVGAILGARGVSLIPSSAFKNDDLSEEISTSDLLTVVSYFDFLDAEADRLALEAKGLKSWIVTEQANAAEPDAPNIHLKVLPRDKDLAALSVIFKPDRETFKPDPGPSTDLPAELAGPPCPKCGSRDVVEKPEIMEVSTSSGSLSPKEVWLYNCASCGYKWPAS